MNNKNPIKRRSVMKRSILYIAMVLACLGLIMTGCRTTVVKKDEASAKKEAPAAKYEARGESKEGKPGEDQAKKDFEKSLVAKKEAGIEGQIYETKLLKDIYFDFDRFDIRKGDADILKENAAWIKKSPNMKIQVEGHCDERGTAEYNLALGERRANSVQKYLVSLGLPGNQISIISYGEEKPADPGHTEEAWAKNRRAHFVILSK
jgi:peptidoglycan-associated lipoprotein